MGADRLPIEQRVLVMAPTLRDGQATMGLLTSAGIACSLCETVDRLCFEITAGCAALVIPEEIILGDNADCIGSSVMQQPVWSDLPVIMLSRAGGESTAIEKALRTLGNASVVERPMRISTFLSMVRVAQRARERQYQVRDHLEDRKRNEERLQESEQHFRAAFDQTVVGIVLTDLEGKVERVNDAFCQIVGYSRDNLIAKDSAEYTVPENLARTSEFINQLKTGSAESAVFEKQYVRADGSIIDAQVSLSVVKDTLGIPSTLVAVIEDVTQRKRARDAMSRDAALLTNVRDSVIVTDLQGNITYWNDGATALFGWTAAEMLGRPFIDRLPEHVRADVQSGIEKIAAGETEFAGEWLDYRKDGSPVWIEVTTRLARGSDGQPMGIIGVSRDITTRKQAESELKTAKETAEAASRAKDEFLAVLSHELRTPLTPVLLTASMLENNPRLPAEFHGDIATIRQNVELESRLISDLLDVTRITKGKIQLDMQEVDLHALVRSAIAICQREASAHMNIDLVASHQMVRGDSTRLQQIFWNLINNSIKFTGAEGVITIRSEDVSPGRIRVEVSDTGAGIDPELLPRLFNAFEQGEIRTQRQRAGLGLGLSISRKLAELHGGTITASSLGRGKGATFTVELPVIEMSVAAPSVQKPSGISRSTRQLKLLLVEDHDATLKVMARLLRHRGHQVTTVSSVASANAAVEMDDFDIIVSDLGLPDGSGFDIMRPLRDRYAGRAIALTGYGMDSDIEASREAGFSAHLTKPIDVSALETVIDSIASTLPRDLTPAHQTIDSVR